MRLALLCEARYDQNFANEASAKKDSRVNLSSVTLLSPFATVDHSRGGVLGHALFEKMKAHKRIHA